MKNKLMALALLATVALGACGKTSSKVYTVDEFNAELAENEDAAKQARTTYTSVAVKGYWDVVGEEGEITTDNIDITLLPVWDEEDVGYAADYGVDEATEELLYEDDDVFTSYLDAYLILSFYAFLYSDEPNDFESIKGDKNTYTCVTAEDNNGDVFTLTYEKDTYCLTKLVCKNAEDKGNMDVTVTWSK